MNKFEKVGQHFLSLTKHTTHCQLSAGLSGEHRFCLSRYRPPLAFPSAPFLCLIFVPFHYPMVRSKCSPSRSPPPLPPHYPTPAPSSYHFKSSNVSYIAGHVVCTQGHVVSYLLVKQTLPSRDPLCLLSMITT